MQQEVLLPQTDLVTRCVSQNLASCCITVHHVFYLILYISALVANKRVHNSVGTTCTTSPEQIEVTELEGYSRPTYNKLVHSATTRSTVVGVIHKLTVDEFVDHTNTPTTFCGEIF